MLPGFFGFGGGAATKQNSDQENVDESKQKAAEEEKRVDDLKNNNHLKELDKAVFTYNMSNLTEMCFNQMKSREK